MPFKIFWNRMMEMYVDNGWFIISLAMVVIIPTMFFLLLALTNIHLFTLNVNLNSDLGAMGLQILRAKEFNEFSGIYSRWKWNHPGPVLIYYYALADTVIPYLSTFGRLSLAQFLLNYLCMVWVLVVIRRIFADKSLAPALFFSMTICALLPLGPNVYFDIWPPYAIIIPMLLFFISAAALAMGNLKVIIPMAISIIICVQSQVSTIVTISIISIISMTVYFIRVKRGDLKFSREDRLILFFVLVVLIVSFLPVIIDLCVWGRNSNPVKLVKFIMGKGEMINSFALAFDFVAYYASSAMGISSDITINRLLLIILSLAAIMFFTKSSRPLKHMSILTLAALLLSIYSVMKVRIPQGFSAEKSLERYLMFYQYGIVTILFFISCMAFVEWINRNIKKPNWTGIISIFLSMIITIVVTYKVPKLKAELNEEIDYFVDILKPVKKNTYELYFRALSRDHMQWMTATGIAYRLKRDGFDACVPDEWLVMFGREMSCAGKKNIRRIYLVEPEKYSVKPAWEGQVLYYKKSGMRYNHY